MSVATLSADSIAPSAVANFSDVLSSREPGVSVQMQSGTTGGGSRIRIRGSNSASLGNQPLLVIDGVRVDNAESDLSTSVTVGGQAPSRFDDLDPEEIEDITILKGPAASALYGSAQRSPAARAAVWVQSQRRLPDRAGRDDRHELRD
jgi:outer membrane receptor for ferrienterochelin and colicin